MSETSDPAWPRITVVTPTYNRIEFLEECIESVLAQGYPNLEYIICDGGSTNQGVLEIIRKYQGHLAWSDSRPDRGHAEAIKRGFDHSTGEIMAYLCSDDAYIPDSLWEVGRMFRDAPNVDVVYGNALIVSASGAVTREIRAVPMRSTSVITCGNLVQPAMFWTRNIYGRAGMDFGGKNLEYAVFEPQVDLMYRFVKSKARWAQTRKFLTRMRQHDGAISSRFVAETRRVQRECLVREFPYLSQPIIYGLLWNVMRVRQAIWHIIQGEWKYLLNRGRS